ncbi:hypothetical protein [Candidatus Uabimicrobium amorphum]|uniref:Uncharacterized protein n=1 Tax=Uabimicrobium amorphum TaxID=2596890 RepID=A0A5S9ISY2_UABAM|nr:hypothetical protein [Candidatus Uabimicrobium amorphum]BBM87529.1 hypothetical protein UABAM_05941 [Candidatus Uabimicrobium amorphum]
MTVNFPDFIDTYYKTLSQDLNVEKRSIAVGEVFFKTISFIGKLHLLEYAQFEEKDEQFHYWLFSQFNHRSIEDWTKIFAHVAEYDKTVLSLQEFAEIFDTVSFQERFTRLKWFYEVIELNKNLASISDVYEAQEHLQFLPSLLGFIAKKKYEVKDGKTFVKHNNRILSMSPFFAAKLIGSEGLRLYETNCSMKDFHKERLTQSYRKYQAEKKGIIDFTHRNNDDVIIMPWIENFLEQTLDDIFSLPPSIKIKTIMIEGAPATGKTTLCSHIEYPQADYVCKYYISPQTIYQDSATFKFWFYRNLKNVFDVQQNIVEIQDLDIMLAPGWQQLRKKIASDNKKVICCIDGINFMPQKEFKRFLNFVNDDLFCNIVFVFFGRSHSKNKIDTTYKICLQPKDNAFFEEAFDEEYVESLHSTYLQDETTQKIFQYILQTQKKFSVKDLSEELEIHTYKVIKCIKNIKPLINDSQIKKTLEQIVKYTCEHDELKAKLMME